jgi:hypothetical protein
MDSIASGRKHTGSKKGNQKWRHEPISCFDHSRLGKFRHLSPLGWGHPTNKWLTRRAALQAPQVFLKRIVEDEKEHARCSRAELFLKLPRGLFSWNSAIRGQTHGWWHSFTSILGHNGSIQRSQDLTPWYITTKERVIVGFASEASMQKSGIVIWIWTFEKRTHESR